MRIAYLSSLVFALMTSLSSITHAAPAVNTEAKAPVAAQAASSEQAGKIDLNTADAAVLQRELSGIGAAKAQAIVKYRESNGPFASVDELLEVKGIGKVILESNREKLKVN
ncbi:ComEA family DNA-binding protein [Pseudomonas sp. NPDC089530]|uniref:ComEA family DNA-binding protein n=1 Tax=Pseudomonas sp. NPDC089530 TaxID=3390651 RepID=UPI003D0733FC